ncbi:MAG: DMT family transporter [Pseudomonadota bacterium]
MNTAFLYGLTVLIWGTTWIAIKYQLGEVMVLASIGHRFLLSAIILWVFLGLTRRLERLPLRHQPFLVLQGLCLFCGNYYFVYTAEITLASGLVAVVFGTMMLANVLNGYLFLRTPVRPLVVAGGLVGLAGIALVFWPVLRAFNLTDENFVALLYCLAGTWLASAGNIIAARNSREQLPLLQATAWAMSYGTGAAYVLALLLGTPITFDWQPAYLLSLGFLALFGSVLAFWAYLTLIGRIGPDRAGYANLLFPLMALGISTALEGYEWTLLAAVGIALVLIGNWIAMTGGAAYSRSRMIREKTAHPAADRHL